MTAPDPGLETRRTMRSKIPVALLLWVSLVVLGEENLGVKDRHRPEFVHRHVLEGDLVRGAVGIGD